MSATIGKNLKQDCQQVIIYAETLRGRMGELASHSTNVAIHLYKAIGWFGLFARDSFRMIESVGLGLIEGLRFSTALVMLMMTAATFVVAYVVDTVT